MSDDARPRTVRWIQIVDNPVEMFVVNRQIDAWVKKTTGPVLIPRWVGRNRADRKLEYYLRNKLAREALILISALHARRCAKGMSDSEYSRFWCAIDAMGILSDGKTLPSGYVLLTQRSQSLKARGELPENGVEDPEFQSAVLLRLLWDRPPPDLRQVRDHASAVWKSFAEASVSLPAKTSDREICQRFAENVVIRALAEYFHLLEKEIRYGAMESVSDTFTEAFGSLDHTVKSPSVSALPQSARQRLVHDAMDALNHFGTPLPARNRFRE